MNNPKKRLLMILSQNLRFVSRRTLTSEEITRQNELFAAERKRQFEKIGRIEKIEVEYIGSNETTQLVMNKNLSTPYDCAKHLGETFMKRSVVALINHTTLWHMHKPLPDSCKLELLHYHSQPNYVNKVYWRTCSFLLGALINNSFKDNIDVKLHSFPSANVRSGSFVHDVQLSLDNWIPEENELKVLSIEMIKFCQHNHPLHCLDVSVNFALDIFKNNPHKKKQIPDIAANNGGKISLFKVGQHVDISKGPMITNTSHIGRFTVSNVHKLDTDIDGGPIYRFQGVSLPSSIVLDHFSYGLLEERAKDKVHFP